MNFENLKNISAPIETKDKQERKEILFSKIGQISLAYAFHKFEELRADNVACKFSEIAREQTPIKHLILRPVYQINNFSFKDHQEKIDLYFKDFYRALDSLVEKGEALENILILVNEKKESIIEYLGLGLLNNFQEKNLEHGLKILEFNQINNIEFDADGNYADLEKIGFSKSDSFIEVHADSLYETSEKNLGQDVIKKDLAKIAEYIVDKAPEVTAVLGRSWLLNVPLTSRLGFKKIDDKLEKQDDFSTWMQFIDKNGQIDNKRFAQFLKTGELPYRSVRAYIKTEDFLKLYLSSDKKGDVLLREINKDKEDYWQRMEKEFLLFKQEWELSLYNHTDFEAFLDKHIVVKELLSLLSAEDKDIYLNFLKRMYDKDVNWNDVSSHKSTKVEEIDEKINNIRKDDLYQSKKVFI